MERLCLHCGKPLAADASYNRKYHPECKTKLDLERQLLSKAYQEWKFDNGIAIDNRYPENIKSLTSCLRCGGEIKDPHRSFCLKCRKDGLKQHQEIDARRKAKYGGYLEPFFIERFIPKIPKPSDDSLSHAQSVKRFNEAMKNPRTRLTVDRLIRESETPRFRVSEPTIEQPKSDDTDLKSHPLACFVRGPNRKYTSDGVPDNSPKRFSTVHDEMGREWYVETRGTGFYGSRAK